MLFRLGDLGEHGAEFGFVKRASKGTASPDEADTGTMLLTAEEALAAGRGREHALPEGEEAPVAAPIRRHEEDEIDADSVFAKLKSLKTPRNEEDGDH